MYLYKYENQDKRKSNEENLLIGSILNEVRTFKKYKVINLPLRSNFDLYFNLKIVRFPILPHT